jgi:restriction system protein
VIDADALGMDRICVQTKRYGVGKLVRAGAVRNFIGALDRARAAKGVLATTSGFSTDAVKTAETLGKRVVLLDGPALARLMIRHGSAARWRRAFG